MPPRLNNKNNKKKKKSKSESAVSCAQCSANVSSSTCIYCICTRVVFCSEACQGLALAPSGCHACPGPPDQVVHSNQRLVDSWDKDILFLDNPSQVRAWNEEYCRTVSEPMHATYYREGLARRAALQDMSVKEDARFADQGNVPFAYHAGVRFRDRMLGDIQLRPRDGDLVSDNTGQDHQLGVLETNELAFKYLSQAAEGNHALAMQSLAECYEKGIGVRRSMRMCRDWLWRASLHHSVGALPLLERKSFVVSEMEAQCGPLQRVARDFQPGQSLNLGGPTVASLLVALYQPLLAQNYVLPAFASEAPTLRVGARPRQGITGPLALLSTDSLKMVVSEIIQLERCGIRIYPSYGRRGCGKAATAQAYSAKSRSLDSVMLVVPPAPGCDETPTDDDVMHWEDAAVGAFYRLNRYGNPQCLEVCCVHIEDGGFLCQDCITDARERLEVVSRGSVALSLHEPLENRGHTAIFRLSDGTVKSESFKDYGRGEVECGLAALVAAQVADCFDPLIVHPLFVAQDPNMFWTLVFYHGCIRAALEYVAPHVDWDEKVGRVKAPLEQDPIITESRIRPGSILRKCGNDICLKIERDGSKGVFSVCGRCQRRHYCSQQCQKSDWTLHKRECNAAAKGRKPTAAPAIPSMPKNDRNGHAKHAREDSQPQVEEKVVIHGLVAKPELNGRLGEISGALTTGGRYPVKVAGHASIIAAKASNLHRLGVFVVERKEKKKARKFECFAHGSEVCSECSVDFFISNHLSNLCFTGAVLSRDTIESFAETYFASIKHPDDECSYYLIPDDFQDCQDFPAECYGLKSADKRFLLRALLSSEDESLLVAAAIAGMACFAGRSAASNRPYTVPHLEALLVA